MFDPLFFYLLGPLRGPRAPKNRILLNLPKKYKKTVIICGPARAGLHYYFRLPCTLFFVLFFASVRSKWASRMGIWAALQSPGIGSEFPPGALGVPGHWLHYAWCARSTPSAPARLAPAARSAPVAPPKPAEF